MSSLKNTLIAFVVLASVFLGYYILGQQSANQLEAQGETSAELSSANKNISSEAPKDSKKGPLSDEDKLRLRSQARWDAVVKGDFDKVYEFATPAYRKTYDKTHFFNQYGGQIVRTKSLVTSIKMIKPDEAKVITEIFFIAGDFSGSNYSPDTWRKVDGEWWFIETQ